jgi:hypothetical protein
MKINKQSIVQNMAIGVQFLLTNFKSSQFWKTNILQNATTQTYHYMLFWEHKEVGGRTHIMLKWNKLFVLEKKKKDNQTKQKELHFEAT